VAGAIAKSFELDLQKVDEWCQNHTVVLRKKSIFRTISDSFTKAEEFTKGFIISIVKKVQCH
jgi:hypothetical protein